MTSLAKEMAKEDKVAKGEKVAKEVKTLIKFLKRTNLLKGN